MVFLKNNFLFKGEQISNIVISENRSKNRTQLVMNPSHMTFRVPYFGLENVKTGSKMNDILKLDFVGTWV